MQNKNDHFWKIEPVVKTRGRKITKRNQRPKEQKFKKQAQLLSTREIIQYKRWQYNNRQQR